MSPISRRRSRQRQSSRRRNGCMMLLAAPLLLLIGASKARGIYECVAVVLAFGIWVWASIWGIRQGSRLSGDRIPSEADSHESESP